MIAYYKNSKGDIIDFMKSPYRAVEADWYDADWQESAEGYEKIVNIDVFGNRKQFIENMENLYSVLSVDAENDTFGELHVNDTFLQCRIITSQKSNWKGYVYSEAELVFQAPRLAWVEKKEKSFYPQSEIRNTSGLDFEFDYPFDFSESTRGVEEWTIEHTTASDFYMIIYGPCVNPRILINGQAYQVFTTLEKDEYLIIDSRNNEITKYLTNGTTQNMFGNRLLAEESIFTKIPPGLLLINWSGDYGFDLILFLERREAKW